MSEEIDLYKLTVKELHDFSKKNGIKGYSNKNKEELIKYIIEFFEIERKKKQTPRRRGPLPKIPAKTNKKQTPRRGVPLPKIPAKTNKKQTPRRRGPLPKIPAKTNKKQTPRRRGPLPKIPEKKSPPPRPPRKLKPKNCEMDACMSSEESADSCVSKIKNKYPQLLPNNWEKCQKSGNEAKKCISVLQDEFPELVSKSVDLPENNIMGIVLSDNKKYVVGVALNNGEIFPLSKNIPYNTFENKSGKAITSPRINRRNSVSSPSSENILLPPSVFVPSRSKDELKSSLKRKKTEGKDVKPVNLLEQIRERNKEKLRKVTKDQKEKKTPKKGEDLRGILAERIAGRREGLKEKTPKDKNHKKKFCSDRQVVYNGELDICIPIEGGVIKSEKELNKIDKAFQEYFIDEDEDEDEWDE
jgi:hypothetical protein